MKRLFQRLFRSAPTRPIRSARRLPWLEQLEDRCVLATINVPASDTAALIAAVNTANYETTNPGRDDIVLVGGTYTFSTANNFWYGPTALPAVSSERLRKNRRAGNVSDRSGP